MKRVDWFKQSRYMLLALMLIAVLAVPVAAQEPEDQGGDVGAAQSLHAGFCVNPNSNSIAGPACPAGVPQTVPSGGSAATEVTVSAGDSLASVTIAFDYNSDVVRVKDIRSGSLFAGLTEGVDYIVDRSKIAGYAAPLDPINEPVIPAPGGCGVGSTCWRSYISITMYNYGSMKIPITGNGSLIKIYWDVQSAAVGADSIVTFPILSLADKSGSTIWPCLPSDGFHPNPSCGPMPIAFLPLNVAPDANLVVGSPSAAGLDFQVALEGGKVPGDNDPNCNFPTPNPFPPPAVCRTDVAVTAGVFVDVADAMGNISIPFAAGYPQVTATRPGYLSARAGNVLPGNNLGLVTLMAGDVTGDNVVNIFDLTVVAGSLNAPVGVSTALEMMDFNGDGVVTIADLALIAKNYGLSGPRPITIIP
jgi:hypothetical protein